jgi:hypothetical protein
LISLTSTTGALTRNTFLKTGALVKALQAAKLPGFEHVHIGHIESTIRAFMRHKDAKITGADAETFTAQYQEPEQDNKGRSLLDSLLLEFITHNKHDEMTATDFAILASGRS